MIGELIDAEEKAKQLFRKMEVLGLVEAGKTEIELNREVYKLADELFGIKKYWHKRIVRSGKNTLCPYRENPPDLVIRENDILFFDFGPVFENWEADIGRTYVTGNDERMWKLKSDVEAAWQEGKDYYMYNKESLTGADFYTYTKKLASKYGWDFGNIHCGHLIGNFPHEELLGEEIINYIHPDNHQKMSMPDINGNVRYWIYEIHFVDTVSCIGGFYEQLLK